MATSKFSVEGERGPRGLRGPMISTTPAVPSHPPAVCCPRVNAGPPGCRSSSIIDDEVTGVTGSRQEARSGGTARLEPTHVLGERDLGGQPFHARGAEETHD